MDLVWIPRVSHGGTNKVPIKIVYITHAHVSKFFKDEQGDVETSMEWNTHKDLPPQNDIQNPINKKPPWAYLVYIMQCSMVLIFKCLSQRHMTLQ
jgi:hypothetical protein